MSAVANIVLNDAQATPVAHTFTPLGPDSNGVWWWEDQVSGIPAGYPKIALSITRPPAVGQGTSSKDRVSRVKISMHLPTMEALSTSDSGFTPAPTVAYVVRYNCEFILPERASLLNRKDIRKYIDFLMAEAQVTDAIENLRPVY